MICLRLVSILVLVIVTSIASYAQDPLQLETIPQTLLRVGESLTDRLTMPSGDSDMTEVLRQTELIVRGTIGLPTKAYLSKDQTTIYTDYPLIKPVVLYDSRGQSSQSPRLAPEITVTVRGGSIQVGALTFTLISEALRELPVGAEGLFLLKSIDGKYQPVGYFFGAFEISGDRITRPFTQARGFAAEYRGASVSETAQTWVAALAKQHQERK